MVDFLSEQTVFGDFHIHTLASSHAYSSFTEIVTYAKKIGLKYVGLTDHGPKMVDGPHPYFFSNLGVMPTEMDGVRIFKGIEINILDIDGHTDFDEINFRKLDYAIASFHDIVSPMDLGPDQYTNAFAQVVKKPYVRVVGHPGNPKFPVNIPELVELCRTNGVAIEINNSSFIHTRRGSYPNCLEIAKEARRQKADILLSSDAHIHLDLARYDKAMELLIAADILSSQVINFSEEKINKYFGANNA